MRRRNRKKRSQRGCMLPIVVLIAAIAVIVLIINIPGCEKEPAATPTPEPTVEPTAVLEPTPTPFPTSADEFIAQMPLEKKLMQMFMITPEALTGVENVTLAGNTTKRALSDNPVGGLIYFSRNIESRQQLASMLSTTQKLYREENGLPIFLGVDEEGGEVARVANSSISVTKLPPMSEIGSAEDYDKAYEVGNTIGGYLSVLGFNINFAPVADIYSEGSAIGVRAFSSNAETVSTMAVSVADGLEDNGVTPVYKHFPGMGSATADTHDGMATISCSLSNMKSNELLPFTCAISDGAEIIMVSHVSAPNITGSNTPCSLSKAVVTDLLRTQLGFGGIVITDALDMKAITNSYTPAEAAVNAVAAGCDILLMPEDYYAALEALIAAVESGKISEERINESVKRILDLKLSM